MLPDTTPAKEIKIDFLHHGTTITGHPTTVKAQSDLIGALAAAYMRFNVEHPEFSVWDVDIYIYIRRSH
jgi:hypothetical protein